MRLFEAVKDAVSAYDAAVDAGFKPNRSKMICCPFHNDKHPSMKVDKRYICFACGAMEMRLILLLISMDFL